VYRRIVVTGQRLVLTLRDITEAKQQESALARLASTDALTALPNRHWLSVYPSAALKRAAPAGRALHRPG
jgi:GGDEF domain-containing protein